jgi:hypothetical protein
VTLLSFIFIPLTSISYSGDWGIGFFAAARHAGSFLVEDPDVREILCFLCDVKTSTPYTTTATTSASSPPSTAAATPFAVSTVTLRDAWRKKLFIASLGLQLTSEAGTIRTITIAASTIRIVYSSAADQPAVTNFRLRADQTAVASGKRPPLHIYATVAGQTPPLFRGAWEFAASTAVIELTYANAAP